MGTCTIKFYLVISTKVACRGNGGQAAKDKHVRLLRDLRLPGGHIPGESRQAAFVEA